MIPPLTDEQIAGLASHQKEMEERCKKVLEKYEKKPKVKTEEEIKQEQFKKWQS